MGTSDTDTLTSPAETVSAPLALVQSRLHESIILCSGGTETLGRGGIYSDACAAVDSKEHDPAGDTSAFPYIGGRSLGGSESRLKRALSATNYN